MKICHIKVGEFSICDMGMAYTKYQCGHLSEHSAKRELEKIQRENPGTAARIVPGVCPKSIRQ